MLFLFVCLFSMSAQAGPKASPPYYETREMTVRLPAKLDLGERRQMLRQKLDDAHLELIVEGNGKGLGGQNRIGAAKSSGVALLSQAGVVSALTALSFKLKGAEVDRLVKNRSGEWVPVSVLWNASSRTLVVRQSSPLAKLFTPGPRGQVWLKSFGVGRLVTAGREWSPEAKGLLHKALSLLSREERLYLKGLSFHRRAKASKKMRAELLPRGGRFRVLEAVYEEDDAGAKIIVFDSAFKESNRFTGVPQAPQPVSLLTLVHEMGHAFARFDDRKLSSKGEGLHSKFESYRAQYNALVTARNTLIRKHRRGASLAIQGQVREMEDKLTALSARLDSVQRELRGLQRKMNRRSDSRPAEAMMKVLKKLSKAPTMYGQTSAEEAFAECFALFHVDPQALKRTAPKVFDWFDRGEHIRVMTSKRR